MQGDPRVLDALNDVLTGELTAINQYFLHAKMCENWGYKRLADHLRDESIDEMKDADKLIERILFLDGHPNVQRMSSITIGEKVSEQLEVDSELERAAIARLRDAITLCTEVGDHGTRDLFEEILRGEEEHLEWLETQQQLIADLGEPLYLSQQVHD